MHHHPGPWKHCAVLICLPLLATVAILSGCAHFAEKRLEVLSYVNSRPSTHRNLFVFIRGLGGSHRTFAEEGMVDAVWQRGIDFDMMAPNSHFAYYAERTLIKRLREDVILPAKKQGYDNIWLIGPSMGGLGALLYVREYPEDIQGVCLISPFLGDEDIIEEILQSGGVQPWSPGNYSPDEDWQRMFWHWIQTTVAVGQIPPVYLGYGRDDMYVEAQKLLATVLPESHLTRSDGGHDYQTFKALWLSFLDRNAFISQKSTGERNNETE